MAWSERSKDSCGSLEDSVVMRSCMLVFEGQETVKFQLLEDGGGEVLTGLAAKVWAESRQPAQNYS